MPTQTKKITPSSIRAALVTVTVALASAASIGCGSSARVLKPLDIAPSAVGAKFGVGACTNAPGEGTPQACAELEEMMRYQLVASGMLADPEEQAAREIRLTITNFRDVSRALRGLFGGMTGSDFMEARADVVDRRSGKEVGSVEGSCFVATAEDYTVRMMAERVAREIVAALAKQE